MASYRFCRSDDVPFLVDAWNAAYRVHFPEIEPMSVDRFRNETRTLDLWASSCMVASQDGRPIAVMLATKREHETLIHSIGVHPDHQRVEHGSHLLRSLSAKAAILGPPRMIAEIPAQKQDVRRFFEACGYRHELDCTDFVCIRPPVEPPSGVELVFATSIDELQANDAFVFERQSCWERRPRTLLNRKAALQGLAIASEERIEAYLLYDEPRESSADGERRILALECRDPARREIWCGLLVRCLLANDPRSVRIPGVFPGEFSVDRLREWGFEPGPITACYAAEPVPG